MNGISIHNLSDMALPPLQLNTFLFLTVPLQNSPLFQYLQDLGHTDFESCPVASQEEECGGKEDDLTSAGEELEKTSVSSRHLPNKYKTSLSEERNGFQPSFFECILD